MDTCKQCGAEISPAEGYFNNNVCNACAFGLPDSEVAFGGAHPEHRIGTIDELTHEARMADESEETAEFHEGRELIAAMRAAVAEVPSCAERYTVEREQGDDEPGTFTVMCVVCSVAFTATAEDLQARMETQPFAPCGCRWSNVR